jgi:uncharacterized protein YjaZ
MQKIKIYDFIKNPEYWKKRKIFSETASDLGFKSGTEFKNFLISSDSINFTPLVQEIINFNYEATVFDGLSHIAHYFSNLDISIFIFSANLNSKIKQSIGGQYGFAGQRNICLMISKSIRWRESLFRVMVHESFHSIHMSEVRYKGTLAETIVAEGLAENFVEVTTQLKPLKWINYLKEPTIKKGLNNCKLFLKSSDLDTVQDWLHGLSEGIPQAFGYNAGYHLVKEYRRKNPKVTWKELMNLPAEAYFKKYL